MKPKIKKLLIAIGALLLGTNAFAHDFEVDGIYYNISPLADKTVEVTYPYYYTNRYTGSVNIPEAVIYSGITYSVTSIGYNAFDSCTGLTEVTIPNSVTEIGDYAFDSCTGLTEVTIPNSVTEIGDYAFQDCTGLTSVSIGNSVTQIGNEAFAYCTGLTEVNYNAENCTSMGSRDYPVFEGCTNMKTLNIGNSVKPIPSYAFSHCTGLTSVTIPNSVTQIGKEAFAYCI